MPAVAVKRPEPVLDIPAVEKGDLVLWYADGVRGDEEDERLAPTVAVVTGVGLEATLCLNLCDPATHNFPLKDGVRHISDPRAKQVELRDNGAWDLLPQERRRRQELAELKAAVAELQRLKKELTGK